MSAEDMQGLPMAETTEDEGPPLQSLPVDVLGIIARQLIHDASWGTCASLNVASKAIHQDTLQTLWRTCVLWGGKVLKAMPVERWYESGDPNVDEEPYDAQKAKYFEQWEKLIHSRGAKYIEFLAVPFCQGDKPFYAYQNRLAWPSVMVPSEVLPRLKAALRVMPQDEDGDMVDPVGLVDVTEQYRYRSDDLYHLSRAISSFQQAGGDEVQQAFTRPMMEFTVWLQPLEAPISLKEWVNERDHLPLSAPGCYRPNLVRAYGLNNVSESDAGVVMLELVQWTVGGNQPDQIKGVQMAPMLPQLTPCAKLFQKAVKLIPSLAAVSLNFRIKRAEWPEHREVIPKLQSIFRGTYLNVCGRIPLREIGGFYFDYRGESMWHVGPSFVKNVMSTTVRGTDHVARVMFEDPWVPVTR